MEICVDVVAGKTVGRTSFLYLTTVDSTAKGEMTVKLKYLLKPKLNDIYHGTLQPLQTTQP